MDTSNRLYKEAIVLGGGPAGLMAGYMLTRSNTRATVLEGAACVGGLSRTVEHNGYRFDLGGHRFITDNERLRSIINDLLGNDLIEVDRSSQILFRNRYYDYPLQLDNVLAGLGPAESTGIIVDYLVSKLSGLWRRRQAETLEDWLVARFGKTLYRIFFKDYSEKLWGVPCDRIAAEWADSRIQGLSLYRVVRDAIRPTSDRRTRTLARRFHYPARGFGQISEALKSVIEVGNEVITGARITAIHRSGRHVEQVSVRDEQGTRSYGADEFISSIPITMTVRLLDPPPPAEILRTASLLNFRDMVVVTIMLDRERVTDQTWIYFPETDVPFGRIHEPGNWSTELAPEGHTHLVVEYFCDRGDDTWKMNDEALVAQTVSHLERMNLIASQDVSDSKVIRLPNAYPVFEKGFREHHRVLQDYLGSFDNLHLAGRGGQFRYLNTDHAMESGMQAAEVATARLHGQAVYGDLAASPTMTDTHS